MSVGQTWADLILKLVKFRAFWVREPQTCKIKN